jgi:hypothetical protein
MLTGPAKAVSIAEILRELSHSRAERQLFTRPRPAAAPRFHEHLAQMPADDLVGFSTFLKQQNKEDRAAARRLDWCPRGDPATGRFLDIYG